VSPVKYEMGFYIPDDDILHSHRRESLKSYRVLHNFRSTDGTTAKRSACHGAWSVLLDLHSHKAAGLWQ
jgi:hypothetical protein